MALQGAIPIDFGTVFPDGAYTAGVFEAVRDFDRSQGDRFVQQLDKSTGLPVWTVDVIDADAGEALSAHISVRRSPDGPRLRVV